MLRQVYGVAFQHDDRCITGVRKKLQDKLGAVITHTEASQFLAQTDSQFLTSLKKMHEELGSLNETPKIRQTISTELKQLLQDAMRAAHVQTHKRAAEIAQVAEKKTSKKQTLERQIAELEKTVSELKSEINQTRENLGNKVEKLQKAVCELTAGAQP